MQVVAQFNRFDIPTEDIVFVGFEKTIDPDIDEVMFVGIRSDGFDDSVFAFVPTEEEIYDIIEHKWGDWYTLEWRM